MLASGARNRLHVSKLLKLFFHFVLEYMYERLILKGFPLIVLQL